MMNISKRSVVISLCVWFSGGLPAALAQAQGDYPRTVAPIKANRPATTLAEVDRQLLAALQATDEPGRQVALRTAQIGLDNAAAQATNKPVASSKPAASNPPAKGAQWLAQVDQRLTRSLDQSRRRLRQSLMGKLWASPYGAIPVRDITGLETVSDALRLLREIRRLGGGDEPSLESIQGVYWQQLMQRRERLGLRYTALAQNKKGTVLDQRVLQGKPGEVQIYQLIGTADRTVHWARYAGRPLPRGFLAFDALTVDLSRESAAWLLVLEGKDLGRTLAANRNWLELMGQDVRLVLLERNHYTATLRTIAPVWFAPGRRLPYLLPASASQAPAKLFLVQVSGQQIVASWPLANLESRSGPGLKEWISRIIAVANRR